MFAIHLLSLALDGCRKVDENDMKHAMGVGLGVLAEVSGTLAVNLNP